MIRVRENRSDSLASERKSLRKDCRFPAQARPDLKHWGLAPDQLQGWVVFWQRVDWATRRFGTSTESKP